MGLGELDGPSQNRLELPCPAAAREDGFTIGHLDHARGHDLTGMLLSDSHRHRHEIVYGGGVGDRNQNTILLLLQPLHPHTRSC